jgi:hypothetical protein
MKPRRTVVNHLANGARLAPLFTHVLLCLTLKPGQRYVVDVSGAQYGHHEPVLSWDDFVAHRLTRIMGGRSFGETKTVLNATTTEKTALGLTKHNYVTLTDIATKIVGEWLRGEDLTRKSFLALGAVAYQAKSDALLAHLEQQVALFVQLGKQTNQLFVASYAWSYPGPENRPVTGVTFVRGDESTETVETSGDNDWIGYGMDKMDPSEKARRGPMLEAIKASFGVGRDD